jgi:predicted RNA-binding Zn-ribbon protein involved in translation (DUF1610 family)
VGREGGGPVLIPARTAFAIRCPQCGKMETAGVSRFELGGGHSVKLNCSCGSEKLMVGVRPGQVWLQIPCYLCDGVHFQYYTPKRFWDGELKTISCTETDLQLGVCGPEHEVDTYTRTGGTELDRLLEDAAFGEYFDSPEVMYQALSRVHNLAEEGNLSCSCGNRHISVDIFPERLDLTCPACGRTRAILAGSQEDLAALERMRRIEVGEDIGSRRRGHKK